MNPSGDKTLSENRPPPNPTAEAESGTGPSIPLDRIVENVIKSLEPAPPRPEEIPETFGRYHIIRELGRGGMGAVFLARDRQLDRLVALKIPFSDKLDAAESIERFYREARAMASLRHPNLCSIYDVGRFDNWHYLTMEFIEGLPLSDKLKESGLTVPDAIKLVRTIALVVHEAHEAGVVHRDLKPANIMINRQGEPIIMDFGLARRTRADETSLTQSGLVMGSPSYMAPEQVEARHDEVGPATDIYAMGAMLYQLLTGQCPFVGSVASVLGQIVSKPATPPSQLRRELDPRVDAACLRALAKSPRDRFSSAAEFADELTKLLPPLSDPGGAAVRRADPSRERTATTPVRTPGAAPPPGSRPGREAELRQVTVAVFAYEPNETVREASGSSSEWSHLRGHSFARFVSEQVAGFGGAVVPTSGEDVLVCFGFPVAFEDAAQRAVRAALQLMRELTHRDRENHLPEANRTRVAIHSGEAVADRDESRSASTISLIGEACNTVTRLSAATDAGLIAVSPATHQRVAIFFQCESLGVQRVRGLSQPVELFKVVKEASSRNRVELVDPGNLTPLIGRDTELTILKDRWEQALDGLGQIILLIGDAGLGKSRLIRELREHVTRQDLEGASVIELRCSQYHQNAPYYPLVEFLTQLLKFDHFPAGRRQDLVHDYLGEFRLDTPESLAIFCKVLGIATDSRVPAISSPPQKLKEQTEQLLLSWLNELAAIGPVLLIVEDLHWVDPSTVGLIERHVEQFESGRSLTLLTFRPEFETPWRSKPHTTHIALNRLTKRQVGEMMRERTRREEIPEIILKRVIERTEGIPLFIEEFSTVILESGILDRPADEGDSESMLNVIPATLHDLFVARLDRMNANREVVQFAATIGREFSHDLLAAACGVPASELARELDKLVKAEILFQRGAGGESNYIFKHALLQDAAYRSMLSKKRQSCHRLIAEALETRFPDTAEAQPALLAQHFGEAGMTQRAIEYWLKAGRRSAAASAVPEAIQQFHRGLDLVRSLPASLQRDELELRFQMPLGGVLVQAKGYGASEPGEVFSRARGICEKLGRRQELGLVLAGTWGWTLVRADYAEALRLAEAQVRLGQELRDPGLQGEACWAMTCTLFYTGRFNQAAQQARQGIRIHDAHPECWRPFAAVAGQSAAVCERGYLALSLFCLGEEERAIDFSRDAVELARRTRDPFSLSMALYHGAWLRLWAGRAEELKALSEEGLTLCRELSFHFYTVTQQFNVAAVPLLRPDPTAEHLEHFVATIRAALKAHLAAGSGVFVSKMYWLLADALRRLGRYGEAQAELDLGFQHELRSGERFCDAELHRLRGEVHRATGDATESEKSFARAEAVATAQGARTWLARVAASRAAS